MAGQFELLMLIKFIVGSTGLDRKYICNVAHEYQLPIPDA